MSKTNLRILTLSSALIALAACSPEAPQPPVEEPSETGEVAAQTPPMDEPAAAESTPNNAAMQASDTIPAAFQGTWDFIEGSCALESDLRLEISPQQIVFYESLGTVKSVRIIDDQTVDVALAMEGEGETWERSERLTLDTNGSQLIPSAGPGEESYNPLPRKRCTG